MNKQKSFLLFIFVASILSASFILLSPWPSVPEKIIQISTPTPTVLPTLTLYPSPTLIVKKISTPTPKITISPDTSTATTKQLFISINSYRQEHGLSQLSQNASLCSIAQTRARQLSESGHLSHDGFGAATQSQTQFHHIAEILQWFPEPKDATYLVYTGWNASGAHREQMLDGSWTHGCAGTSENYWVFIFARE